MSFAAEFPDMYASMKREERDTRALIGSDQCVIDEQRFFLRGCLEVPILGSEEPSVWGLWVSVKEEVYDEVSDCWTLEGREKLHGAYKGRLANSLTVYPETLNLKTEISLQPVGTRPLLKIGEPLARSRAVGRHLSRKSDGVGISSASSGTIAPPSR
jgi:hypothetical protein